MMSFGLPAVHRLTAANAWIVAGRLTPRFGRAAPSKHEVGPFDQRRAEVSSVWSRRADDLALNGRARRAATTPRPRLTAPPFAQTTWRMRSVSGP